MDHLNVRGLKNADHRSGQLPTTTATGSAAVALSPTSTNNNNNNNNNNFSSYPPPSTGAVSNVATTGAADICQMCMILGIQVMCPNEATKRKHTDDHRRAAAAFLSLEDWALPPTESQIGKCFPLYTPDFFQHQTIAVTTTNSQQSLQQTPVNNLINEAKFNSRHHPQQQQQQQQQQSRTHQRDDSEQIQQTVNAILCSAGPSSSTTTTASNPKSINNRQPSVSSSAAESRAASISAAVAAVAANSSSQQQPMFDESSIVVTKKARSRSSGGGGSKKRAKMAQSAAAKNGEGMASIVSNVKEQFTKSVIAAIETSLATSEVETNFQLVRDKPSCKWPRFIIDGYAYRVGRVYSTGKCELRCILKQGCNGKAVVEKNGGVGYVARIVPGSVHFHSPPTFSKPELTA